MKLGLFSISLTVKDLQISKDLYKKLGFEVYGGHEDQGWLILKNGTTIIGIFEGMFDRNMLTFNPGWDENAEKLDEFVDVRDIQKNLKSHNLDLATQADEDTTGPASFIVIDPDGNPILIDQHV